MDENIINQLVLLKDEKKQLLEKANIEKRDLTDEEKKRSREIDELIFRIEHNGGDLNPTGFIKTSVKVKINNNNNISSSHVDLQTPTEVASENIDKPTENIQANVVEEPKKEVEQIVSAPIQNIDEIVSAPVQNEETNITEEENIVKEENDAEIGIGEELAEPVTEEEIIPTPVYEGDSSVEESSISEPTIEEINNTEAPKTEIVIKKNNKLIYILLAIIFILLAVIVFLLIK
jgi:hypothetical protein